MSAQAPLIELAHVRRLHRPDWHAAPEVRNGAPDRDRTAEDAGSGSVDNPQWQHEGGAGMEAGIRASDFRHLQWDASSGMEIMAKAVEEWLDARGIGRFVVVGHSMGGYVALELLNRIPERVAGIGLFHSHPLADDEDKRENRRRTLNLIRNVGHAHFMEAFVPALFAPSSLERCSERIRVLQSMASSQLAEHISLQVEAMMNRCERLSTLLDHPSLPKWVVLGEEDPILPISMAWDWICRLDHVQVNILPQTGHMGMDECPENCLRLLEEFRSFVNRTPPTQKSD